MSREEARSVVRKWADSHDFELFDEEMCDTGKINDVEMDGFFDFEALLDALGIPR